MSTTQGQWDRRFLDIAFRVAEWSKDPDEGVGAVIASPDRRQFSVGYNGYPRGSDYDGVPVGKELKNRLTIHAERNALDNAPFPVQGATLYVTKPPCFECMKGVIQKGIARVVSMPIREDSRWRVDQRDAQNLALFHNIECLEVLP